MMVVLLKCTTTSLLHLNQKTQLPAEPTIKYFQDVKLFFCLKEFEMKSDVVTLLHINQPGAHLEIGVVFRVAWTQDHPG